MFNDKGNILPKPTPEVLVCYLFSTNYVVLPNVHWWWIIYYFPLSRNENRDLGYTYVEALQSLRG